MASRKPRRFKLNRDTGVSIYIQGRPDPLRLEPGSHYTTTDKAEIDALQGSADVTEVKIPERRA
jgi:hypothetical protein